MSPDRRRRRWLAALAFAFLVLAPIALFYGAHSATVRSRVIAWIVERARTDYRIDLTIGEIEYDIRALSVRLHHVAAAAAAHRDAPFFRAQEVALAVPWATVRRTGGDIEIASLRLVAPAITIHRFADGRLNLPPARDATTAPPVIRFRALAIERLDIAYIDDAQQVRFDARGVSFAVKAGGTQRIEGDLTAEGGPHLAFGERDIRASRFGGIVGFDGRAVDFRAFDLAVPQGRVTLNGRIDRLLASPTIDAQVTGLVDVRAAAAFALPGTFASDTLRGTLDVAGRVSGELVSPVADLTLRGRSLRWQDIAAADLDIACRVSSSELVVTRARGRLGTAPIDAGGRWHFDSGVRSLTATWRQLDPALIRRFMPALPAQLAAALDGRLDVTANDFSLANATATIRTRATADAGRPGVPVDGTLVLRLQGGRWQMQQEHRVGDATHIDSQLEGRIAPRFSESTLSGPVTVKTTDLASTVSVLKKAGIELPTFADDLRGTASGTLHAAGTLGSVRTTRISGPFEASLTDLVRLAPDLKPSGTLTATGTIAGSIDSPAIAADIEGRISVAGLDLDRISGQAELDKSRARVTLAVPRFGATADGIVALAAPFEFSARASAPRLDVATLPAEWFKAHRVATIVDVGAGATGSLDNLDAVKGSIDIAPTKVLVDGYEVELVSKAHLDYSATAIATSEIQLQSKDLQARVRLDDAGIVHIPSARAEWRGAVATASGTIPATTFDAYIPAFIRARLTALAKAPAVEKPGTTTAGARLDIRVDNITPAVLEGVLPDETRKSVIGAARATARLEATAFGLEHLRGTIDVETNAWTIQGIRFEPVRPPRFTIANGRMTADSFEWRMAERPENRIGLTGGLQLDPLRLDARIGGITDLRLATAFIPDASTFGDATLDVHVTGEPAAPRVDGKIQVANAGLTIADPAIAVTDVRGTLLLSERSITTQDLNGRANGGTLTARGSVDYGSRASSLTIEGRGIGLDFPLGLQSEVDADLALRYDGQGQRPQLGGRVSVLRGEYRRPLSLITQLLSSARLRQSQPVTAAPSALDALGLDLRVVTNADIQVDNNYGRFDIGADLRVVGTLASPGLLGRADIREGGQLFLGGTSYQVERGSIDFSDPSQIVPDLNISARARVAAHDITMTIAGTPDKLSVEPTADDPSLSKADIVSLLLTGRPYSDATKQQAAESGQQLLGLLSGEVLGAAGRYVGLDTLRFERGVTSDLGDLSDVASETDPSARLTLAKNLSPEVRLLLSQSLTRGGGLTWIASYQPRPNVDIRMVSRENHDRAYEIRHQVSLGAPAAPSAAGTAPRQPRVEAVRVTGDPGFTEAELVQQIDLKPGERFDFRTWRNDRDRLSRYYVERGFFEARIVPRRTNLAEGGVALDYEIRRGPATKLRVNGAALSTEATGAIQSAWRHAVFDRFLEEEAARLARIDLVARGFLEARTRASLQQPGPDARELTIDVEAGTHRTTRHIRFEGNRHFSSRDLQSQLAGTDLTLAAWLDPAALRTWLRDLYRSSGFLSAQVRVDPIGFPTADAAILPVAIDEGPRFRLGDLRLDGIAPARQDEVRKAIALDDTRDYSPHVVDEARQRAESWYRKHGFNSVAIAPAATVNESTATVDLTLRVEEGIEEKLARVEIGGLAHTTRGTVAGALELEPGQPVDLTAWQAARKRLYDTGVFRRVDIDREGAGDSVVAKVTVEERPRWRVRYGFQLRDEARPASEGRDVSGGLLGEILDRNLFGRAASTGATFRYDRHEKLGRAFLTTPQLFGRHATTSVFLTRSREARGEAIPIFIDKSSVTAEQRINPIGRLDVTYGYSLEQNHTFNPKADPDDPLAIDFTVRIARLTGTSVIDTRDDPFDTRRGLFHSSSLEYAAGGLGSDLRFVKYLAQQTYFRPFDRVVLASSARVGLAHGFGQDLIGSEQFFAGGATSVRGYEEDAIAGRDILDQPIGGNAMIVLNQEIRFPVYKWVGGVGFVDAGNVFPSARAVDVLGLMVGTGVGVRVNTPFALVRVDFGVPLSDRSAGARRGRWYFSIGHIF